MWYSPVSDKYRLYSQAKIGAAQASFAQASFSQLKDEPIARLTNLKTSGYAWFF
jgi:hypothetical protein